MTEKAYIRNSNITFVEKCLLFRDIPTMWRIVKDIFLHTEDWPMGMSKEEFLDEYEDKNTGCVVAMLKGRPIYLKRDPKYDNSIAWTLSSIFIAEDYQKLNVKDSAVLDIGSSYGDTAIYFVVNGASYVEGYEIEKDFCELAKSNISFNSIENVVINNKPASSSTIDDFAKQHSRKRLALKIDCEGGEYEQILNAKRLCDYDQVLLEYHYGYINLKKKLEGSGFTVEYTRPKYGPGNMLMGLLYAYREHCFEFKQFNIV